MLQTTQTVKELLAGLTPQQRDSLMTEAMREAKNREAQAAMTADNGGAMSFEAFKVQFWRKYQRAIFDTLLDEKLAQVAEYLLTDGASGISRLACFAPPRHGKSMRISRMFPAWLYSQMPDLRAMIASYGQSLSEANSRAIRNIMDSQTYKETFPQTRLATTNIQQWETAAGGILTAGSVGASITGHGGRLVIIDDPVKSRQEAESPTFRERAKQWYDNDLLSRLEEPGAIVLMATRFHQDDLSSYLLDTELGDEWTVLNFPALAEENDLLGREFGAALWPEKYPVSILQKRRAKMGEYAWNSLYQQRPIALEGGIFKRDWFSVTNGLPEMLRVVRAWDLAMSSRTTADYTVGVKMGLGIDGRYYILDVVRFQKEWGEVTPKIAEIAILDGRDIPIGIEKAGYMSRAVQELCTDSRLHHHVITGFEVDSDKVTRAAPLASRAAAGLVSVLDRYWTEPYLEEMCSFNSAPHDDQVDASSLAYAFLADSEACFEGEMTLADESQWVWNDGF